MATQEIVRKRPSELKTRANIRSNLGSEEALRRLGKSLRKRQRTPLLIDPGDVVFDGHRRLAAGLLEGIEFLDCLVVPSDTTPAEARQLQWDIIAHSQDISAFDKAVSIREIKDDHPHLTNKQLAEDILHIDPSSVTQYLSLFGCISDVLEAAKDGLIGLTDWYTISKAPDQAEALAKILGGMSRMEVESENRAHRNGNGHSSVDRPTRYRIPIAAGGAVVIDLPKDGDLAAAEAVLKEAEKTLRLPRLKHTSAKQNGPGLLTVTRDQPDPKAEALLKEALRLVQDARGRKLALKTALIDWKDAAKAVQDAKPEPPNPDPG
jgi:hypothetical protein